jgi:GAF domain-containing protein
MKSLRDTPVKILAAGLLAAVFIVLVVEYLVIHQKINALQGVDHKVDFVRKAQANNQQIALQLQNYLNGQDEQNGKIASLVDEQDYLLRTLQESGRVDGTDIFLDPLSRLQKITFDNLLKNWNKYKASILVKVMMVQPTNIIVSADSAGTDSTQQHLEGEVPLVAASPALFTGQWLTLSSWYDKLIADIEEESNQKDAAITYWLIAIISINLLILVFIYWVFKEYIIKPIHLLESNTSNQLQTSNIPKNEMGALASQINETIEHLKDATEFVEKIGEGNLSIDYKELDKTYVEGKNKLADSLISMQSKLKALNDEEQKRKWSNEGLAKFVDILRSSNDDIHELGNNIISSLVKYTGSNQGGLYTLNDESANNNYLELIALFAFDIKKFEKQVVKLGEGILGQAFLEKETTYLNEIPQEYIRITSGLGDANPKTILLVPLKLDQVVYGIVELASFKDFQPHEIAFVEKLGETIASTLASVKSAQRNRNLIEQFQQQTEEMRAQEEEMRQNMEELQATQEELARKEKDYIARIAELENQVSSDGSNQKLVELQEEIAQREREHKATLAALEQQVKEKPLKGDDWQLAEQVERELKINLEAIKITRQELGGKS